MSTTSNGGSEQPLTRKQLRELAAAQASQQDTPPPTIGTPPTPLVPTPPVSTPQAHTVSPPASAAPSPFAPPAPPRTAVPQPQTEQPQPSRGAQSPQTPAPQPPTRSAGPTRVSAATRIATGAGPTSEQARRAPASAVIPANLEFAPDIFAAQNGSGQGETNVTRRSIHTAPAAPMRTRQKSQSAGAPSGLAPSDSAQNVPEVVPPSQTSAIRRIDETGEMSTITATGRAVPEAEVAATVTRKSIWAQRTKDKAATEVTAAASPTTPALPPLVVEPPAIVDLTPAERAEAAEQDTGMMLAITDPEPEPSAPESAAVEASEVPLGSDAETAILSPVTNPVWDPEAAAGPAQALPDWADITSLDSDLPTDSLASGAPVVLDPALVPVAGEVTGEFAPVDAITDDAEPVAEIDHSYTWLHYLILIAIAVVLGMVVWKVGLDPKTDKPDEPEPQSLQYSVSQTLL